MHLISYLLTEPVSTLNVILINLYNGNETGFVSTLLVALSYIISTVIQV